MREEENTHEWDDKSDIEGTLHQPRPSYSHSPRVDSYQDKKNRAIAEKRARIEQEKRRLKEIEAKKERQKKEAWLIREYEESKRELRRHRH